MDDILIYFSYLHQGDWDKIYSSIKNKEMIDQEKLKSIKSDLNTNYITILSENYPSLLKHVNKPPFVIYYQGDVSLLNSNLIFALVGTREPSEFGLKVTKELTKEFVSKQVCIISGLAKGIDAMAHQTTLLCNGKTIAVLGNGFNHVYPSENSDLQHEIAKNGLLISEYPPFVVSNKANFPIRNRIIASLANAIIVTEAKLKSGSQITVSYGLEMGKEIYCVPSSNLNNSACNYLIKQGAKLIENGMDVIEDFANLIIDKY
jgi:DNA processing protein